MADDISQNERQILDLFNKLNAQAEHLLTIEELQDSWNASEFSSKFDEGLDELVSKGFVAMDAAQISVMLTQKGFNSL